MQIRTTVLMTLVILLCAGVAFAAPTKLSQQGRLLDGDSQPLTGTHGLVFKLLDAETGGTEVWQEERVVSFEEGYYSVVLGEQVPLSDLLFAAGSVWLELTVDGAVLSPRHEVVSVPFALRAAVADAVEGGPVDADEISVGGSPVIDSNGNWVGTAVDWSELTGVPADLTDGDADTDTLLALPCADGFVAKYSASLSAWDCAEDLDTDTQLTNGQVAAAALAEGFVAGAHTVDTDTQLTSAQVAATALAEGFVTGAHTVDTDTQLTEAQVDGMVANNGYLAPDSSGNVGIGTANPTEVLTVAGTVESSSGGFKFPDGSTQISAAAGAPGTVLYMRCRWTGSASTSTSTCTPNPCPSGWNNLGVTSNIKTDATMYGSQASNSTYSTSTGQQERACYSPTPVAIVTTRCLWTGSASTSSSSCTPPSCPSGWTNLGVTGVVKNVVEMWGAQASNSTYSTSAGYEERSCSL